MARAKSIQHLTKMLCQYFVAWSLFAITACIRFLYQVIRFWHRVGEIFAHSSVQRVSKSFKFLGCLLLTLIFNSFHKFSIGLRSGDWLGHGKIATLLSSNHFDVALAVCFGSLSCWNTKFCPNCSISTDLMRFSDKMSRYIAPFMRPLMIWRQPVPLPEKQPHTMILAPANFYCRDGVLWVEMPPCVSFKPVDDNVCFLLRTTPPLRGRGIPPTRGPNGVNKPEQCSATPPPPSLPIKTLFKQE